MHSFSLVVSSCALTAVLAMGNMAWAQEPPTEEPPDAVTAPEPNTAPPQTPVPPPPVAAPPPELPPPPTAQPTQPLDLPPPPPPSPTAAPPPAPTPTRQVQAPSQLVADDSIDAQLYGGIFVAGVGAALLVVAGVAVGRVDQLQQDPGFIAYRDGFQPDLDVCEQAAAGQRVDGAASPERVTDICDEATGWEITNYVAVPGGLAMLGMGLYLTITSDTAQIQSPVAIVPTVGPSNAGLTMTGRF